MNKRFKKYLALRGITQKEMSTLSGVSEMSISRFCSNDKISVRTLVKLLSACDDLSLDYLFFGYGSILKKTEGHTTNYGTINNNEQNDIIGDNAYVMKTTTVNQDTYPRDLISEKDRIITECHRIISERDATISQLLEKLNH